ncbi:hypothetical protein [Paraglaciecola marina]|uniref:hypothetical protein n=1 Tax=Paraglaciecola marina TaxID=2500157 RepID=UPI00105EB38A|nr:hypothetical protein [Paraglaciecola marina]
MYANERTAKPDMRTQLGAKILRAAKQDLSLSDEQKLSTHRCKMLHDYVDFKDAAFGQAIDYSCRNLAVGITFHAGSDLGRYTPENIIQALEMKFKEQFINAKVFVKQQHKGGSAVAFFINGQSYTANWMTIVDALNTVQDTSNEARLIYLKNKQITPQQLGKWVKGSEPEYSKVRAMLD